jgi:hypothetical protein
MGFDIKRPKHRSRQETSDGGDKSAHNFTKLRIVSKDRVDVETKKANYLPLTSKEPLAIRLRTKEHPTQPITIEPQRAGFYLKLERFAAKKSRSIDPCDNSGKKGSKENARKFNNQSEDKNQIKYMLNDNFFKKTTELANCYAARTQPTLSKTSNRFLAQLMDEFSRSEEMQIIGDHIRKVFSSWGPKSSAKAFRFRTQKIFYRIVEKIGMGCFGQVYLATQVLTGTSVALKVISKNDIQSKNCRAKIEKEIEVLKMVNHNRFVIKLMEVFEDEASVYFVFEYVKNGDLIQFFRKNPLMEERDLKAFFYKILRGVEYLHANKVIHRDIKLDNILLDEGLQPKLCDLGISSVMEEGKKIMDTGGTPAYLAPEVIKAEGDVCEKSDVWSLGVLLYLLNFGTVPFKSADMQNLYCKILVGTFKFPQYDDVSFDALDIIKRMLVVDVGARLSLEGVLKHRWFRDLPAKDLADCDCPPPKINEEIEQAGLRYLVEIGFHEGYVRQSFEMGAFNHLKAVMDCLRNRFSKKQTQEPPSCAQT